MAHPTLAFIGAGNMARAIIGGLLAQGYPAATITASEPDITRLDDLKAQGLQVTDDNSKALANAEVVVLAVKPQLLKSVLEPLAEVAATHQPLFISVAAGVSCQSIQRWLGGQCSLVRCMPNTPALVGAGACGLFANDQVSPAQRQQAQQIMAATGLAAWVDTEAQLHAVTAVSGSGPAYYFLFMEAMIQAGIEQGLPAELATELTLHTARGAAEMALRSELTPAQLRHQVTSPNGTTERAINRFVEQQLDGVVAQAMRACAERSQELAEQLDD